jgi:predicted MFS family arabinose efflux permease
MLRPSAWFSFAAFAALAFIAGGRTLAGSAAALDLAPALRLGVTGVRTGALQGGYFVGAAVGGAALALGGYPALGLTMALLFAGATLPHLLPARRERPQPHLP